MFKSLFTILVLNVWPTLKAVRSPGVGLVIFSELSATVMIGGVLIIIQMIGGVLMLKRNSISDSLKCHRSPKSSRYLIVLMEAVFAFIEKVVVVFTGMALTAQS